MDDHVGTKFTLWDGDIHGTNLEVVKNKLLTQKWYGGEWEEPSTVTFTLKPSNKYTVIELIHKNVPEEEHDNISKGWKTYYLGPLKKLLENSPA